MILGGTEVNQFAEIRLILEAKFGDNPLFLHRKLLLTTRNVSELRCTKLVFVFQFYAQSIKNFVLITEENLEK